MKKNQANMFKALKQLKAIQPDSEWKQATQQRLLADLQLETTQVNRVQRFLQLGSFAFRSKLILRPVGAFVAIAAVIIGPGLATMSAARASLPGDALYTVKRGMEQVQVNLAFSDQKKTELQIQFVSNRLDELQRLTHEEVPGEEREQKISLALEELKKDTNQVTAQLDVVEAADEAVRLAKIIEEKTSSYSEVIEASVSSLSEEEQATEQLQQALSTVQEAALGAVDVLVKKQSQTKAGETSDSEKEDLKARVQNQLQAVERLFAAAKRRFAQSQATQTALVLSQETEIDEESEEPNALDALEEQLDVIEEDIAYAKELLELDDLSEALRLVTSAKADIDTFVIDLAQANNAVNQEKEDQSEKEPEQEEGENEEKDGQPSDEEEGPVPAEKQDGEEISGEDEIEAEVGEPTEAEQ